MKDLPEEIFKRCVEDSSDAIMLTGCDGKLVYVNKSWQTLYGYSAREARGKSPSLLHSGVHEKRFYQEMWGDILSAEKGYWKGEVVNRCKNGELRTVLLTITPYRGRSHSKNLKSKTLKSKNIRTGAPDEADSVVGFMGLAVDLTSEKEMQKQLVHQDKLALLGVLAGALAHEIGTPLGVVRGRAEMLGQFLSEKELAPASPVLPFTPVDVPLFRKSLSVIVEQADRISRVMSRILAFARLENGMIPGQAVQMETRTSRSVAHLFRDAEELVNSHFRKEQIRLEMDSEEPELETGFAPEVEQILINLLLNAAHALEKVENRFFEGTCRTVRVSLSKSDMGEAGLIWVLAVEDNGKGVAPEIAGRIFEPFFTTNSARGTGLGLSISSRIAADLGGTLGLCPQRNSDLAHELTGARFELRLPEKIFGRATKL